MISAVDLQAANLAKKNPSVHKSDDYDRVLIDASVHAQQQIQDMLGDNESTVNSARFVLLMYYRFPSVSSCFLRPIVESKRR